MMMKMMVSSFLSMLLWLMMASVNHAFVPPSSTRTTRFGRHVIQQQQRQRVVSPPSILPASADDESDDDDESSNKNPFQDENYPELEFVDYSDPNYQVDQGVTEEMFSSPEEDSTEAEIERMREDRRRRNDEYQFETYFKESWLEGKQSFYGEWTIYRTSTFLEDNNTMEEKGSIIPKIIKNRSPLHVKSRAYKIDVDNNDSEFRVDASRICHEEIPLASEFDQQRQDDPPDAKQAEQDVLESTYWPNQEMKAFDFRGQQGNMCVGAAYSICQGVPLLLDSSTSEQPDWMGPFSEMRTELAIMSEGLRFRIKLDYRVKEEEDDSKTTTTTKTTSTLPALKLKTLTVCREAAGVQPTPEDYPSLFLSNGAPGGLYDPPPVGSDEQASQYILLDLEGGASALIPFKMDQDPTAFGRDDNNSKAAGWVTTLDWTPDRSRYQVDRKVQGGANILGLRTLELSEVESARADRWRPKDGGRDMQQ